MIELPENYVSGVIVGADFDACDEGGIVCGLYLDIKLSSGHIVTARGGHRWTTDRKLKRSDLAGLIGKNCACVLWVLSQTGGPREVESQPKQFLQRGSNTTVIGEFKKVAEVKFPYHDKMTKLIEVDCGFFLLLEIGKKIGIIEKWNFIEEEGILNFENLKVY